jgi:hypothetical protein
VDEHTARYQKRGESELNWDAYKALLTEHYDVMASEGYDWWTLRIAVPKNARPQALLAPFEDARGYDDLGIDVRGGVPVVPDHPHLLNPRGGDVDQLLQRTTSG